MIHDTSGAEMKLLVTSFQVKKISAFEGTFSLGNEEDTATPEPLQELLALLDGFSIEAKGPEVVQPLGVFGFGFSMFFIWFSYFALKMIEDVWLRNRDCTDLKHEVAEESAQKLSNDLGSAMMQPVSQSFCASGRCLKALPTIRLRPKPYVESWRNTSPTSGPSLLPLTRSDWAAKFSTAKFKTNRDWKKNTKKLYA